MTSLPCKFNPKTGKTSNYSGQEVVSCADCSCETKSFEITSGVISGSLEFKVTNIGCDFRLEWRCPGCGAKTLEDCTPIDAIPLSKEIENDALCVTCRGRADG